MSRRSCTGARRRGSPPTATTPARCATRPPAAPGIWPPTSPRALVRDDDRRSRWARCGPSSRRCRATASRRRPSSRSRSGVRCSRAAITPGAQPYLRRAEEDEALRGAGPPRAVRRLPGRDGPVRGAAARRPRRRAAGGARTARAQAALETGQLSSGARSFVLGQLGIVELWTGDLDAATAHLERAHVCAVDGETDWTALAAGAHLAVARAFRGEIVRALRHADAAVVARRAPRLGTIGARGRRLLRAGGGGHPARAAMTRRCVSWRAPQRRCTTRAIARCARSMPSIARSCCVTAAIRRRLSASCRPRARRSATGRCSRPLDDQLLAQEALLRAALGEPEAGRALLERAERETATSVPVANAIARLRLLEGEPDAARDALAPHLDGDGGAAALGGAGIDPRRGVAARCAGARRSRRARARCALAGAVARSGRARRAATAHPRARQSRPAAAASPCPPRDGALGDRQRSAGHDRARRQASAHARSPCCWPSR